MPISTLSALSNRHCTPRCGNDDRLPPERTTALLAALPGWALTENGKALRKRFDFADYYQTLAFVNALAFIAHREHHHPDLEVHYNQVNVRFSTHDVSGLSDNDFICAAKVEQLTESSRQSSAICSIPQMEGISPP